jgi:hypothetical protein
MIDAAKIRFHPFPPRRLALQTYQDAIHIVTNQTALRDRPSAPGLKLIARKKKPFLPHFPRNHRLSLHAPGAVAAGGSML